MTLADGRARWAILRLMRNWRAKLQSWMSLVAIRQLTMANTVLRCRSRLFKFCSRQLTLFRYLSLRYRSSVGDKRVVCIASTDLTHYGPGYGFCPAGVGDDGVQWAKDTNDKSFIELALEMQAKRLLADAGQKDNACGGGAAAAAVAAAKELGAEKGMLLSHTSSNEVMIRKYNQSSQESVGYAGIVF